MANFVCFLAARAAKAPAHVRDRRLRGAAAPLRVYASTETHTWIQKAADLFGLGTDAIRWIPADDDQRMDVAALERQIVADRASGDVPFMVVGTAGTVSTGAVDPLAEIAAMLPAPRRLVSRRRRVRRARRAGARRAGRACARLSDADSVAVDPHKWLYAPLEAGCALVRRPGDLLHAFSYHPATTTSIEEVTNYFDYGPQNSRGFRALKVWLALRQVGSSGYLQMIGDDMRLSRHLHALVAAASGFRSDDAAPQHHDVPLRPARPAAGVGAAGRRTVSARS